MKFILAALVLLNLTLFAWYRGYLEPIWPSGREPQRLLQQIAPEKIRLLDPAPLTSAAPEVPGKPTVTTAAAPSPVLAAAPASCIELGNFSETEAARFETQLGALALNERLSRRTISEASSFMVMIPPLADKEAAERKSGELRRLEVKDFYVVQAEGELRYSISLGIFKTRAAAESHLAELVRKGVRSARVSGRGPSGDKIAFQLRDLNESGLASTQRLTASFNKIEQRDCAARAR